jgi:hypothetical protein
MTMENNTRNEKNVTIGGFCRRAFLRTCGALGIGVPMALLSGSSSTGLMGYREAKAGPAQPPRESYWNDQGYFVDANVDASRWEEGIVRARTDGDWKEYYIRMLDQGFTRWNLQARIAVLSGGMMCLDGPHSAALATYGANRGDSNFSLNNTFKGFGFVPRAERLDDVIDTVTTNWTASMTTKATILTGFYQDTGMWDFRLLGSLELYTTPLFETHSFLNQMANPQATIAWLAIPGAYEVRAVPRLIHPMDPNVPGDDWKRVRWINMIHDFYHGGPFPTAPSNIAAIYYVVEEFDNSPTPGPMGVRQVPPL